MRKPENHFKRFIYGNQKQQRCSFQFRNEQLHVSHVRFISMIVEEASKWKLALCRLVDIALPPPFFFLARAAASTFFTHEGAPAFVIEKIPSR